MKNFKKLMVFGMLALIAAPVFSASAVSVYFDAYGYPLDKHGDRIAQPIIDQWGRRTDRQGNVFDTPASHVETASISYRHAEEVLGYYKKLPDSCRDINELKKLEELAKSELNHATIVSQERLKKLQGQNRCQMTSADRCRLEAEEKVIVKAQERVASLNTWSFDILAKAAELFSRK